MLKIKNKISDALTSTTIYRAESKNINMQITLYDDDDDDDAYAYLWIYEKLVFAYFLKG